MRFTSEESLSHSMLVTDKLGAVLLGNGQTSQPQALI